MSSRIHRQGDRRSQKPLSPKLWHAITTQARARFNKYPSPAAAHWVHQQYILHGGQFAKADRG